MEAISPRLRDAYGTCEALRYEVADLKILVAGLLSAAVPVPDSASVGSIAPVPALLYEEESGYWGRFAGVVEALLEKLPPPPSCPAVTVVVPGTAPDPWDRVLHLLSLLQSDQFGLLIIGYGWGFHTGIRRWILLLPALAIAPRTAVVWILIVVATRSVRAIRSALAGLAALCSNRWGAGICRRICPSPRPATRRGPRPMDAEVAWTRRAASLFWTAVVAEEEALADPDPAANEDLSSVRVELPPAQDGVPSGEWQWWWRR